MTGDAAANSPFPHGAPKLGDFAPPAPVTGIILAAGAGTRMGMPKALVRSADGTPWLHHACALLTAAGCDPVLVVLGARADEARELLPSPSGVVHEVDAARWADGMAHSLRAGIAAAAAATTTSAATGTVTATSTTTGTASTATATATSTASQAVLIVPVDMPELPLSVVLRLLDTDLAPTSLRQAVYRGQPGHPVLAGRAHWAALTATLNGDRGARGYLVAHNVEEVECSDLFDGHDVDTPNITSTRINSAGISTPDISTPAAPLG